MYFNGNLKNEIRKDANLEGKCCNKWSDCCTCVLQTTHVSKFSEVKWNQLWSGWSWARTPEANIFCFIKIKPFNEIFCNFRKDYNESREYRNSIPFHSFAKFSKHSIAIMMPYCTVLWQYGYTPHILQSPKLHVQEEKWSSSCSFIVSFLKGQACIQIVWLYHRCGAYGNG